jgi:hypothetical protein
VPHNADASPHSTLKVLASMTLAEQIQLTSDHAAQAEQIKTAAIIIALSLGCAIILLLWSNSR